MACICESSACFCWRGVKHYTHYPIVLVRGYPSARLGTRTKESNAHASNKRITLYYKVKAMIRKWYFILFALSTNLNFLERFELEYVRWDPKDCELQMIKMKSGETLMEV